MKRISAWLLRGFRCEQARDIAFHDVVIRTVAGPALAGCGEVK